MKILSFPRMFIAFVALVISLSVMADETYAKKRSLDGLEGWLLWYYNISAEHTYACTKEGKKTKCYSRTGGSDGGSRFDYSSIGTVNGIARCVFENGRFRGQPCYVNSNETVIYSGDRNASCHQETNHMLRVHGRKPTLSGPVVNWRVGGGDSTYNAFGYYGNHGLDRSCLRACN